MRNRIVLLILCVALGGCDAMRQHAPNVALFQDHRLDYLKTEPVPKLVVSESLDRMPAAQRYALPDKVYPRVTEEVSIVPPDFSD